MSRLKLLVSNVGFFGGLKVISSLFPLLILPYVSSKLKGADEFGIYDMFMIVSSLFASFSMLGVSDAMFRQFHYKQDNKYRKNVLTTGFCIVLFSSIIVGSLILCTKSLTQSFIFDNSKYYTIMYYIVVFIVLKNLSEMMLIPSRIVNNKKHIFLSTILNAVFFYSIVIILLHCNLSFYSLVFSHILVVLFLCMIFAYINRKELFPLIFSRKIASDLLKIGVPLMPIFIIYWANNSIVRFLVMKYLGPTELGVFAIGSKYASVSTFLQVAFAGGWSYFTFSTMKDKDQVSLKSRIFEALLFIIVIAYIVAAPLASYFFEFAFEGDFERGSVVFGQLFLSPLFLMLYQMIANQFTILGKSYYSLISLGSGFLVGLGLNILLLERGYGIQGVSYSIPLSYLFAILVSYLFAKRLGIFEINKRSFMSLFAIVVANVVIQKETGIGVYLYLVPLLSLHIYIYKNLVFEIVGIGKRLIFKKA